MASMNIRYNDSTSSYYVDLIEQGLLEIRTFRQKIDAPYVVGLSNTTLERLLNLESKLHLLKAELTVPTNEWMSEDHIRVISRLIELRANPDASESSMENNSLKLLLPGGP